MIPPIYFMSLAVRIPEGERQGGVDWVGLLPVVCLSVLLFVHSSASFLVFSSSPAVLFKILTMFRSTKVSKYLLFLVLGVPFLQPLMTLTALSLATCGPGLSRWVVVLLFLLELGLQGVPCWLVWLCVLRCFLHPEVLWRVSPRFWGLGIRWCAWLLGVRARFV